MHNQCLPKQSAQESSRAQPRGSATASSPAACTLASPSEREKWRAAACWLRWVTAGAMLLLTGADELVEEGGRVFSLVRSSTTAAASAGTHAWGGGTGWGAGAEEEGGRRRRRRRRRHPGGRDLGWKIGVRNRMPAARRGSRAGRRTRPEHPAAPPSPTAAIVAVHTHVLSSAGPIDADAHPCRCARPAGGGDAARAPANPACLEPRRLLGPFALPLVDRGEEGGADLLEAAAHLPPLELAVHAVRRALERHHLERLAVAALLLVAQRARVGEVPLVVHQEEDASRRREERAHAVRALRAEHQRVLHHLAHADAQRLVRDLLIVLLHVPAAVVLLEARLVVVRRVVHQRLDRHQIDCTDCTADHCSPECSARHVPRIERHTSPSSRGSS